ncbi:MAG: hypothetical protein P8Z00_12510 [Anaerolineales bacterium]|jgi:hypothetical protein
MGQTKKSLRTSFERTLFLDLLIDRRTRPIVIYATIVIGVGAALYHWLE